MKRLVLPLAFLALSVCSFAQNQKGFYIKGGAGYFFKVTPVEFPNVGSLQPRITKSYYSTPTGPEVVTHDETITGSFGDGFRAEIVPGYNFNKYLALELGIHYYSSQSKKMAEKTVYGPDKTTVLFNLKSTGDVKAFDLAPNLVFSLPLNGKLQPYSRIGIIVPVHGRLRIKSDLLDAPGITKAGFANIKLQREEEILPRPTIGFQSALGTNYYLSKDKKWAAYCEMEYRNISVSSQSKTVKKYTGSAVVKANGQSVALSMDQLHTSDKETEYENSVNPSAETDPNKPSKDLRSYINIGGLGFNVGFRFNF